MEFENGGNLNIFLFNDGLKLRVGHNALNGLAIDLNVSWQEFSIIRDELQRLCDEYEKEQVKE